MWQLLGLFLWRLCTDYLGCGLRLSTSTLSCVPIVIVINNVINFNCLIIVKARGMNGVPTKSIDDFLVFSPELVLVPKY